MEVLHGWLLLSGCLKKKIFTGTLISNKRIYWIVGCSFSVCLLSESWIKREWWEVIHHFYGECQWKLSSLNPSLSDHFLKMFVQSISAFGCREWQGGREKQKETEHASLSRPPGPTTHSFFSFWIDVNTCVGSESCKFEIQPHVTFYSKWPRKKGTSLIPQKVILTSISLSA